MCVLRVSRARYSIESGKRKTHGSPASEEVTGIVYGSPC